MRNQLAGLLCIVIGLSACGSDTVTTSSEDTISAGENQPTTQPTEPQILTVMTHDSFAVSAEVVAAFEQANHATLRIITSGDVGTALNRAILSRDKPIADVFFGVDNTFLSRALDEDIFEEYNSPILADIPAEFKLDPQNRALPVDYGDVCLNYDIAYFDDHNIEPPTTLEDLLLPDYRGLLVVENPAMSSPGLAFLLATISSFGEDGYLEYWDGLAANDLLVVNDWETAYYSEFSRWGGSRPIVVSYSSSPPFEVLYAEEPIDTPPTAVITSPGSCYRQIEFVGILQGTTNQALAEAWIDFMLSPQFQEDMPLQMYVFPVNPKASLDEAFVNFLVIPSDPATLDPSLIAANRETWLQAWTDAILR
jgi:thiamine transport system substrate-binding protein